MTDFPGDVSLTYYHYPLANHRFAEAAARAALCATTGNGRFGEMANQLFVKQDSFGLKPWVSYATAAGVVDTTEFLRCMADTNTYARIEADREVGRKVPVVGIPTVIINGWLLPLPPPVDTLRHIVRELLAGRSPFSRH